MVEEDRVDISEEINPLAPTLSQPPPTHALPPSTPAGILPAYSGAPPAHLPPLASSGALHAHTSQTPSASEDQARIAALEGTVNQLATSMAANMAKLFALLKGSNRASLSSTPPPGPGPMADPTLWAPPIQAPENIEVPAPPTLHTSTVHPFTSQFLPPPAPTAVPLPPTTFLSSEHVLSAPPPVSIPAPAMAYTVPPPMVFLASSALASTHLQAAELPPYPSLQPHTGLSYQAPPPINTTFHEPGTPTHAAQFTSPTHFFPEADAEQERRGHPDVGGPLPEVQRPIPILRGNAPHPSGAEHERNGTGPKAPQQYSVNLTTTPTTAPTYFPPPPQHQPQSIYYSAPPVPPPATSQPYDHFAPTSAQPSQPRPPVSRAPPPAQQNSTSQGQQAGGTQSRPRKQYSPLPAPLSHIYQQLLAGNQIRPISPSPNFDPSVQDQSKHCEYHQGASGHTLDNCWRLRDEIQRRIDSNRLTFNAVKPPNVQANPLPDYRSNSGPSINMISICASGRDEEAQEKSPPFLVNYTPEELIVGLTGHVASPAPFVVDIPAREPYSDSKCHGVTRSGRVYESSVAKDKGKAPAFEVGATPKSSPFPPKKVTEEEAEAFMKIVKASEYKVVEQMAKSPAHITLLTLLLGSEPHQEALLQCNNYVIGRVMIDNGSALNVCPVTTLKQMNVDLNRVRPSKTAVRAFDGSRREVNGEIDLLIDVGLCSFSITFQVLDIPNAFSLLLGRPWIDSASAVPSFLHQRLKFIVEERLITETAVPYISVGDDENLPFHSFEIISVIRDYGESGPSRADRMIGKVLLRNNYIPGTNLGARGQGINRPIEVEGYKHRRGLGFRPSCHEIIEARKGNHLHRLAAYYGRLNRGTSVPPLSHFFPGPSHTIGGTLDGPSSDSDDSPATPSAVCAVTEEIPSGVHIRLEQENEELDNWTSVPRYSAVIADVLHSNPNPRCFDSNLSRDPLGEPQPVYFGEGLPEDSQGQAIADHLAEFPIDDDTPINTDFPDEGILQVDEEKEEPTWKMYFDGAVNSVGSGVGAVLISPDGRHYPVAAKVDFSCTNNVAEYEACILGLQAAIDFKVKELEVFGDSMITIFQTLGQWKTKDAKLVPYHEYLEKLAKNFEKISFTYTPRAKNQFADALATLASMASISEGNIVEPLEIEVAKGPAHCNAIEASEAKPWYEDIKNFLQTGQYPPFADRRDQRRSGALRCTTF
ncbi:hypothetical protein CRG98_010255 [Punica granatum]|uniref:G-patch domain-containing protein n=2 Tax=Punica granatum TaxID=22663 RepID=A0A2I0KLL3_PUNGR|nr:hypothetical protein CRG98_010255 [Punica granatum]